MTGGEVDWPKVHEIAGRLLKTRTKDLHLTCYFARAWAALEGLDGMATGYSFRWTIGLIFAGLVVGVINVYMYVRERD